MNTEADKEIPNQQIEKFVGKSFAFYQQKWQKSKADNNNPMSWNMAAFFLGLVWMVYRKMYKYAFIVFGVIVVESIFEEMLGFSSAMTYAANIVFALIFGFYGNAIYQRHVNNKIAEITTSYPPEKVELEIERQGGVNIAFAVGISLFFVLLVVAILWSPSTIAP